jgi:mannose-6-phosphate isomerase-like protein (cupin superfamily)
VRRESVPARGEPVDLHPDRRAKHRIENPGKIPLHIIEVQSGSYLGEDDIVRFEDRYGSEGTNT